MMTQRLTQPLTSRSGSRLGRLLQRSISLMIVLALTVTVDSAVAKKKRKGKRIKTKVSKIDTEVVKGAKTIFTALAQTSDAGARLAVVKGLIELEGPSREEGLNMAAKASDTEIRLVGLKEILKNSRLHRKRLKAAKAEAGKLFLSAKKPEHEIGRALVESYLNKRKMKKMWSKALKSGGAAAQYEARAHFIAQGGKTAWKVISKALKSPEGSAGHKQALQAMRDQHYKLGKKWALSNAGTKGEVGAVAKLWIDRVGEKAANKITQGLYKEYRWAAGDKKRPADFPRRVRLAHMLSKRGMIREVTGTLAVAVKNKKGRVDADLDSAKIRVMGWEGLRACRDRKVLKAVKEMMIELQNREEAAPATQWLADWVRDTRDGYAMEVLEEMIDQPRYISRLEAIKALGSLKVRQTRAKILGALEAGDPDLKLAAAEALALMSEPGDEKELHKLIHKNRKHLEVRLILLRSLINLNTPETLKTFKSLINNSEAQLRRVALEGLIKLNLNIKDLERYLNPLRRNDPKLDIRFTVWSSLLGGGSQKLNRNFKKAARWMTPAQLKELADLDKLSSEFFRVMVLSGDDDLSGAALDIFAARGDSARADLEMIFKESSEIKSTVRSLSLLADLAKESGLELYRKGLESRDAEVRVVAFDAMRRFAPKASLEEVKVAMENERKPHPRAEAARAYIAISQR